MINYIYDTQVEKDSLNLIYNHYKIDIQTPIEKVGELPMILEKYFKVHFELMLIINEVNDKKAEKTKERYIYYKEGMDTILSPSEIKIYMEGDEEVLKIKKEVDYYEALFKQISDIIGEIKSLQYTLKTSLEYKKFIGCS